MAGEGLRDRQPRGVRKGVRRPPAPGERRGRGGARRFRHQCRRIVHDGLVGHAHPVPLDHGEFRCVKRAPLAVPIDRSESGDLLLAGSEELLHCKLRRGVEVADGPRFVGTDQLGRKGMEMGLVAGRDLERGRLDDEESLRLEPVGGALPRSGTGRSGTGGGRGDGLSTRTAWVGGWTSGRSHSRKSAGSRRQTR